MRNYLPSGRDLVQIGTALLKSASNVTNPVGKAQIGASTLVARAAQWGAA